MSRSPWAFPLVLAAAVFFCGIGVHPLHEPDEGRYGEIAREMAASGDWVTPRLDGIRYFEKPPLYFWLAGAAIRALGATEAAIRLPSALAALLCVALVLRVGAHAFGARAGALAGALFATSPLILLCSRFSLVDMVLTAAVTGALAALWGAASGPPGERRLAPGLLFWACCGAGFLCKGPVAVALPLAAAIPFVALERSAPVLRAVLHPAGWVLFAAIAAPWYVAMERHNPGYVETFLIEQNVNRLFVPTNKFNRAEPVWFYAGPLLGLFAPWTVLLPAAAARAWPSVRAALRREGPPEEERERGAMARRFMACAVLGPLALLSVAQSKIPYYVLPIFPWMALLAGEAVVAGATSTSTPGSGTGTGTTGGARWTAVFGGVAAVLAIVAAAAGVLAVWPGPITDAVEARLPPEPDKALRTMERLGVVLGVLAPGAAAVGAIALGAAAAAWMARRTPLDRALRPLIVAMALAGATAPWILRRAERAYSGRDVAAAVAQGLGPDDVVIAFKRFYRTLPFYLERQVRLWEARFTEFGHLPDRKIDLPGRAFLLDEELNPPLAEEAVPRAERELRALWHGERRCVAVTDDASDVSELTRIVGAERMKVLARLGTTSVIESRPGGDGRAPR